LKENKSPYALHRLPYDKDAASGIAKRAHRNNRVSFATAFDNVYASGTFARSPLIVNAAAEHQEIEHHQSKNETPFAHCRGAFQDRSNRGMSPSSYCLSGSKIQSLPFNESFNSAASQPSNDQESPIHHSSNQILEDDGKIQSSGVLTRSKVSIFRSLNAAKPTSANKIFRDQHPTNPKSVEGTSTRSQSYSLDIANTISALEVVEKSRLMSEVKEAIITLEHTTRNSKECRKLFVQAKGQIMLCFLVTSCNRSTPHLELIHIILQTLTNVANHRSTTHRLATNEVVEVIIYVCQMYRDKSKLLALSCSLLERIMINGDQSVLVSV
jgi:hypothetical protein